MTYGLGRKIEFDERSRDYNVAALLDPLRIVASKEWPCPTHLDQGATPECVGFSWTHEINAEPVVPVPYLDGSYADRVYHLAQTLDEWPGEDYEGTSVLAGAKAVSQFGWLLEYRWAFNLDDALSAISQLGPVVLGTNWYDDMFYPDAEGQIHLGGDLAGGHAILINGIDVEHQLVRLHNSWGESWGINGDAFLSFTDLDTLLKDNGEICIPLQRALVDPDAPPSPTPGCLGALFGLVKGLVKKS